MVDVRKGQKCMQGSVDGSGYTVLSKGRERIVADHLVFVPLAPIELLQLFETIEMNQCEPRFRNRADVATASFHYKDSGQSASEWIRQLDFRTRVAPAEVGDSEVRSEQV